MNSHKRSILLLGHGSRDPIFLKEFNYFIDCFQEHDGLSSAEKMEIKTAFLELSKPSIPQALKELFDKEVRKIIAIPYFLFRAGHVKSEIPEMLQEFSSNHPKIEISYGPSLWPHPNLTQLAKKRIHEALASFPEITRKDVEVLVVGRGATDKEALHQFDEAVDHLKKETVCKNFQSCFIALSEPRFDRLLPEMLRNGTKNLIIFPYYLFTGILVKRIEAISRDTEKIFSGVNIKIASHFGTDPLMFQMLKEKIAEGFRV